MGGNVEKTGKGTRIFQEVFWKLSVTDTYPYNWQLIKYTRKLPNLKNQMEQLQLLSCHLIFLHIAGDSFSLKRTTEICYGTAKGQKFLEYTRPRVFCPGPGSCLFKVGHNKGPHHNNVRDHLHNGMPWDVSCYFGTPQRMLGFHPVSVLSALQTDYSELRNEKRVQATNIHRGTLLETTHKQAQVLYQSVCPLVMPDRLQVDIGKNRNVTCTDLAVKVTWFYHSISRPGHKKKRVNSPNIWDFIIPYVFFEKKIVFERKYRSHSHWFRWSQQNDAQAENVPGVICPAVRQDLETQKYNEEPVWNGIWNKKITIATFNKLVQPNTRYFSSPQTTLQNCHQLISRCSFFKAIRINTELLEKKTNRKMWSQCGTILKKNTFQHRHTIVKSQKPP